MDFFTFSLLHYKVYVWCLLFISCIFGIESLSVIRDISKGFFVVFMDKKGMPSVYKTPFSSIEEAEAFADKRYPNQYTCIVNLPYETL